MFKNWTNLFTTDCQIIVLEGDVPVYPIFKNGQTSLFVYAKKKNLEIKKNKEIGLLDNVTIFLRDPCERFISGVHTVIELEQISNVKLFLKKIEQLETYDRHFIPQFYWLLHLFKYFRGPVNLLPMGNLYDIIPYREGPPIAKIKEDRKKEISLVNNKAYVEIDYRLIKKYLGETVSLEKLVREFKNALS